MTYFHTDSQVTIDYISGVAALAKENGQSLRIDVDGAGRLRLKRGGGMWSPPIHSTPDDYRDQGQAERVKYI